MLAKRIIPCLDVRDGMVVKGVQFQNHRIVGDIVELASYYEQEGADELVFYDITASSDARTVTSHWVADVAQVLSIPFTVAGGICNVASAQRILRAGADKISINSPALANPNLIRELSETFGRQCLVVGIDSLWVDEDDYVYQYTGDVRKSRNSRRKTLDWVREVEALGAGEIVLNCMGRDGMRQGYDIDQLKRVRALTSIPLVASGGAGQIEDFSTVFREAQVDGALAASIFHEKKVHINMLKNFLMTQHIKVRP